MGEPICGAEFGDERDPDDPHLCGRAVDHDGSHECCDCAATWTLTAIQVRQREAAPADSDTACIWPGCDWHNGVLVVVRYGVELGPTCREHAYQPPSAWHEVLGRSPA